MSAARVFQDAPAVRSDVPMIIGITGPSSSGKTYSALRLATGIAKVRGGKIGGIDTESNRMRHYAEYFAFQHLPLAPPHGPDDYLGAIDHLYGKGYRIIVVDSMSHEHEGEGGVLDQIEEYLAIKCGDDWKARERFNFIAQVRPKMARKKLNRRILQLADVTFILCYRAQDKIKPVKGGEPTKLGWQPITTSPLPYEMIARFLLKPGAEGIPDYRPEHEAEKMAVKIPRQFREFFRPGEALSEELGEKIALWCKGSRPAPAVAVPAVPPIPGGILPPAEEAITSRVRGLKWTRKQAAAWLTEIFQVQTIGELTEAQGDDAFALLNTFGSPGYDAILAEMRGAK